MNNRLRHLWNAICQPKFLYFYYLIALILPNLGLSYTEPLSWLARLTNVVLPLAVYALVLTFCRKPGKMIWILFPLVFIAAFQLVLLYLFFLPTATAVFFFRQNQSIARSITFILYLLLLLVAYTVFMFA